MKVTELRKELTNMKKGECIYINSISLSVKCIGELRHLIQTKVILPDKKMVENMYENVESVMNGTVIMPQMNYYRQ